MESTLTDGVWTFAPSQPVPRLGLPLRMTVIRLADGGLWLHSPTPLTDAEAAEIDALGPVAHIVAPSKLHHLWAGDATRRWPRATLWIAPGLQDKRPDLTPHQLLAASAPWADEIAVERIGGAASLDEHVFFHHGSGTLLVTDLVFNIHTATTPLTPWILRLTGTWDRLAQSRVWWFAIRDRAAAGASARRILGWPIQRMVPCHGDVLSDDAHRRMTETLAWMAAG